MNVSEIVNAACRQLGFEPDADGLADGMEALNILLQEWAAGLGIYKRTRENFSTAAATASYLIGVGQTFNTTRPIRIVNSFVRYSGTDWPVETYQSADDYAAIATKSLQARPERLYFETSYPYGTILLYPTPDAVYDLHIYSNKPFGAYTSTSDDLGLPPEFEPALKFNLALDLSVEFGREASQITMARAEMSLTTLKRLHAQPVPQISTDPMVAGGGYDITGDRWL